MPDNVLLRFINLRRAFFDIKSKERGADRVKPKYKLLTQKGLLSDELEIYVFHILTTTEDSYIKDKTINIYRSDWEEREESHLGAEYSKLCTQIIDVINKDNLLEKIRDGENKFSQVAVLGQIKFDEVINFVKKDLEEVSSKTDFPVRDILSSLFNKTPVAKDLIKKFGI